MTDKIDISPEAVEGTARFAESHYIQWDDGADLIRALSARVAELEAKNRELALEIISANGQTCDAYDAQKTAEALLQQATKGGE